MAIINVDQVILEAADNFAKAMDTKLKFLDTDGSHKDVKKYVNSRYFVLDKTVGHPVYGTPQFDSHEPQTTFSVVFNNLGEGEGHVDHTFEQTETDSFTFSFTEGIESSVSSTASVEVSAEVFGVGGKASGSVTVSDTLSLSSTQGKQESKEVKLSSSVSYDVPPKMQATLVWAINHKRYDQPFTVPVTLTNQVAVWLHDKRNIRDKNSKNDRHHLWFIPIGTLLRYGNLQDYSILSNSKVNFTARGSVKAKYSLSGDATASTTQVANHDLPNGLQQEIHRVGGSDLAMTGTPALEESTNPAMAGAT